MSPFERKERGQTLSYVFKIIEDNSRARKSLVTKIDPKKTIDFEDLMDKYNENTWEMRSEVFCNLLHLHC